MNGLLVVTTLCSNTTLNRVSFFPSTLDTTITFVNNNSNRIRDCFLIESNRCYFVSQFSLIVSQKSNGGAEETKELLCR